MRIFSIFLIGTLSAMSLTAQEQAVGVLNEFYCLGRRNCVPYTTVEIKLPANTVKWFFVVNTTKNRRTARRIRNNPSLYSIFPEISADLATGRNESDRQNEPVFAGDGTCSVYLLKHYSDGDSFETAGGVFFYYPDFSKKNVPSVAMVVDDPTVCHGTQYIGLQNVGLADDMDNFFAVLTVVAITR